MYIIMIVLQEYMLRMLTYSRRTKGRKNYGMNVKKIIWGWNIRVIDRKAQSMSISFSCSTLYSRSSITNSLVFP